METRLVTNHQGSLNTCTGRKLFVKMKLIGSQIIIHTINDVKQKSQTFGCIR